MTKEVTVTLIVIAAISVIACYAMRYIGKTECTERWGSKTEYSLTQGCRIEVNGKLVPASLYEGE